MPKSNRSSGRRRSGRNQGAVEVFRRPAAGLVRDIIGFLIRMRTEILIVVVLALGWHELNTRFSSVTAYVVLNGVPVILFAWPASRRFIIRRFWCVISRHRMRACVTQIRSMINFSGWMPWMCWARPTPVGERLFMWLRPGVCIEDLAERTEHIAVSCWARDARVRRSRPLAALVIVDVIRRDPLTGRNSTIPSPLTLVGADGPTPPPVALSAGARTRVRPPKTAKTSAPSGDTGAIVTPINEPAARPRKTTTAKSGTDPVLRNNPGEDLSDYV